MRQKQWDLFDACVAGGKVWWWIVIPLPAVMIAGAFFTRQSFSAECSAPNFEWSGLLQVVLFGGLTAALLGASLFMTRLKSARQSRDLEFARIRTEGLQWLVVATTGVGATCLALASTVSMCTWLGTGIVLVGFLWGIGGISAVLLHCALVQLRHIELEDRRKRSDH